MIAATRDSAAVLADDLQHIREVVAREQPSAGDLRRLSNQLRRILVEGDLRKVAAPRLGRIEICAPDLRSIYRANEKNPFLFIAADGFSTHGVHLATLCVNEGPSARELTGYSPDARVPLRIETFQNQRVLCFRGQWVSRADIIKYVANVAHGVHSGQPKEISHLLIRKIRAACTIDMIHQSPGPGMPEVNMPRISFNPEVLAPVDLIIQLNPRKVDIALMHLISTGQFLTSSSDVIELERIIA